MRSQVFLLPPPLLQRSAPVSRRLFSLFVRTCHVPRVAPVHEPVRQPEGGEELGLASEEVAEVLLEAPRALVGGGVVGDFFLVRFFFFFLAGFEERFQRERERGRQIELEKLQHRPSPAGVNARGLLVPAAIALLKQAREKKKTLPHQGRATRGGGGRRRRRFSSPTTWSRRRHWPSEAFSKAPGPCSPFASEDVQRRTGRPRGE